MRPIRTLVIPAVVLTFSASVAFADGNVQQKTRVQFGGVIGGIANVFGGKAAREGITSTTSVKGDRRLTVNDRSGELVDLGEEKIYRIDYNRKTYDVVTFDELRKQYEQAKKDAEQQAASSKKNEKSDGPEYDVDVDVKETGQKQAVNGFDAKQVVVTVTVREKGKTLEQSGGAVLTADMWMGPKIAAMREINAFNQRYFKQLYGDPSAEMQQMAVLMATTPAFGKAMKEFSKKRDAFTGEPVRTTLTFETVSAPGQQEEDQPAVTTANMVGGLLRGAMKKRQESKGEAPAAGRSKLFESTTEVLSASNDAADVALPAGFRKR